MNRIDPIILGDNQFLGISHLSQESGRTKMERFGDIEQIVNTIEFCAEMGVKGVSMSPHSRTGDIVSLAKQKGLGDLNFYPLIPYAAEYVRIAGEKGTVGLLNETLKSTGVLGKSKILFKGGMGLLRKDLYGLLGTLIDVEISHFKGVPVKAVFLHNVLTDLALGLGLKEIFEFYIEYIEKNHKAYPGFATMNFARLVKTFHEWGINDPLVMASFNKVGYQMNPSQSECEQCLANFDVEALAMSTLASGRVKPKEAYDYLFSLPNVKAVAVGASTREHAEETFRIINEHLVISNNA